jgi:hypothetical protein
VFSVLLGHLSVYVATWACIVLIEPQLGSSAMPWLVEELEAQGWMLFAEPMLVWSERKQPEPGVVDMYFSLFRRDSLAGETFTYRTEKYVPPHLITAQYIPEPSGLVTFTGLLGMAFIGHFWARRRHSAHRIVARRLFHFSSRV